MIAARRGGQELAPLQQSSWSVLKRPASVLLLVPPRFHRWVSAGGGGIWVIYNRNNHKTVLLCLRNPTQLLTLFYMPDLTDSSL